MFEYVSEAFYIAKTERRPVVLGIPIDLVMRVEVDTASVSTLDSYPETFVVRSVNIRPGEREPFGG